MKKNKIIGILGPTNTGKTFTAMQMLFSHKDGVIGFPLRLLARENFELAKKKMGEKKVALITGEEKIIPEGACYFFCTVEAIPEERNFEFIAIDEVQIAADYERGHNFTNKIMTRTGKSSTIYIGSESMGVILKKIHPEIKIIKKPRLSKLSYSGYKNLTRLPKRSAIIAFSQIEVYEIAEKIKKIHGGVSIIMGALSPEARNSQVKLYESGSVDYIVATDAIGLGLNLSIKNIFFSSIVKFDGFRERFLNFSEISQIAGRAGRFLNDGYFGVTYNLKRLDEKIVKYVENHDFTEIKKIYWRNNKLDFSSSINLHKSLITKPNKKFLLLKRDAQDFSYFKVLLSDKLFFKNIDNSRKLEKLWEICSIPDYSKSLAEFHSRFLKKIANFILEKTSKIPANWINVQLDKIKKRSTRIGDINLKISQIRTWSFISNKKNWIENEQKYQKITQKIEYDLSTYLHNSLIAKFVDDYKTNSIKEKSLKEVQFDVFKDVENTLRFGNLEIGKIDGFKFQVNSTIRKNKNKFTKKLFKQNFERISKEKINFFKKCKLSEIEFSINGGIYWQNSMIGMFVKGKTWEKPVIKLFTDEYFSQYNEEVREKINLYLDDILKRKNPFLSNINFKDKISPPLRAIYYLLIENFGQCKKELIKNYYKELNFEERKRLKSLGFKIGNKFYYIKSIKLNFFNQMLMNIFTGKNFKNFIEKDVIKIDGKNKFTKEKLSALNKLGFYLIKTNRRKSFLVYFKYYEKLLDRVYFFRKKKWQNNLVSKKLKINKFEEFIIKNEKSLNFIF